MVDLVDQARKERGRENSGYNPHRLAKPSILTICTIIWSVLCEFQWTLYLHYAAKLDSSSSERLKAINLSMLCFFSKASWVLERQHCWTTFSRTLQLAVQDGKPLKDVTACRNKRRRRSQLLRTSLVRLSVNSFLPTWNHLGKQIQL